MPKILTIDMETGETVERQMTDEEIAALPEPLDLPVDPD